jgi:RimJ/RimL family protein N-acetyltransferase
MRPEPKVLSGHFCRLEPLSVSQHAEDLYAANTLDDDGRSWTYLPYGPFATFTDYCAWMETASKSSDPLLFAIIDQEKNCAVGIAGYLRITPAAGSIEVGHLHYSPLLQKTPLSTEAMFLMMQEAFTLGYRRYEWKCNALNAASRTAAERLGFTFEGVFRQAAVIKGHNRDTAWFSIIDSEWPVLQQAFTRWLAPENFNAQGEQLRKLKELR